MFGACFMRIGLKLCYKLQILSSLKGEVLDLCISDFDDKILIMLIIYSTKKFE